ncbi:acyl-CoA dehydrogenase family protein [Pusillimonas sp. (ex Stolz et al. 2005)]|uniref:acyl-CoA dehydrogenase family protein n=1 Tax=Pusillimonas sp. (ex Stolz et al. 2005) TaxID=1979962 RepID=UPI0026055AE8|nr:acyl-CoA dehydrogenase family protein [Pusillimonas sp. (ex Stolz et al. 2005)]
MNMQKEPFMDSSYLTQFARSADDSTLFDGAPLTEKQKALIAKVDEYGVRWAERAFKHDREASFPTDNYKDLHEMGFLGLCVPERLGGLGADYRTYMLVASRISYYCSNTANTFNMHNANALWTAGMVDDMDLTDEQRARHEQHRAIHYGNMLNGKIYSQPFSEGGGAAAGKHPFGTTARRTEGGWIINGKKIFASLAGSADYYGVLCTEDVPNPTYANTMFMAVPADAEGVSIVGDWDPLGMRGTVSRTLLFKDVFVPETAEMMPPGVYIKAAATYPHMFMTLTPTYIGLAQAAYDFTVAYLRGEVAGVNVKRRMYPTKQITVAQMYVKLQQAWALFHRVTSEFKAHPSRGERMRAFACQHTVMEYCAEIASTAVRVCGGQAMLKTFPLERMYRDSRCGALMLPWTSEICIDRLGYGLLYNEGERD